MVNVKQLAKKKELITGGTFACTGCQAIYGLRLVGMALGKDTVIINAAGCMTLTATHPYTCYKTPWLFNAIENAASTATGVAKGFEAQGKKVNVVCYAGDGMYSLDYSLSDGGHRRWIAASEEGHRVRVYLRRGAQVVPEKKRKKISEVKIV